MKILAEIFFCLCNFFKNHGSHFSNYKKSVVPTAPLTTKAPIKPIHTFASMISLKPAKTTPAPTPEAPKTAPISNLHCDIEEMKKFGVHVGGCKFTGDSRHLMPINSNSNQGLINGKVLNGAQVILFVNYAVIFLLLNLK